MASVHENVVNLLRDTASIINPSGRFIYGRELYSSFDYGNNSAPNSNSVDSKPIISLLPFSVTINNDPDTVYNNTSISMIFSRSADVADSASREETILSEMASLAENFIFLLDNASKPITYTIGNVQMQPEYQFWRGTNSGYSVTFTLNMKQDCEVPTLDALQSELQSLLQG